MDFRFGSQMVILIVSVSELFPCWLEARLDFRFSSQMGILIVFVLELFPC